MRGRKIYVCFIFFVICIFINLYFYLYFCIFVFLYFEIYYNLFEMVYLKEVSIFKFFFWYNFQYVFGKLDFVNNSK